MNVLEAAASSIGEIAGYVIGRFVGKAFHFEPKRAQKIGEYILLGAICGAAVLITVLYS